MTPSICGVLLALEFTAGEWCGDETCFRSIAERSGESRLACTCEEIAPSRQRWIEVEHLLVLWEGRRCGRLRHKSTGQFRGRRNELNTRMSPERTEV